MKEFSIGDRVRHVDLDQQGTVSELCGADYLVLVLFDENPPEQYNGGANPAACLIDDLESIPS